MAALLLLREEIHLEIQRLEEYCRNYLEEVRADLEEARSRSRMSCLCKDMKRPIFYPLTNRILEMVAFPQSAPVKGTKRTGGHTRTIGQKTEHKI